MRSGRLIPLLSFFVALILLAVSQMLDPTRASAPVIPGREEARISTRVEQEVMPEAPTESAAEKAPAPLPTPTPPPVVNDPRKGAIWFRLLNADTMQPIADTDCDVWQVWCFANGESMYSGSWLGWGEREELRYKPFGVTRTDKSGLVRFSARVLETGNEPDPAAPRDSMGFGLSLPAFESSFDCPFPLPKDHEPTQSLKSFGTSVRALAAAPVGAPIDLLVRPSPWISGVVEQQGGQPAAGTHVYAFPYEAGTGTHDWANFVTDVYNLINELGRDEDPSKSLPQEVLDAWIKQLEGESMTPRPDLPDRLLGFERPRGSWLHRTLNIWHRAVTDAEGRFEIRRAHSGKWIVAAFSNTHPLSWTQVELRRGETRVKVPLKAESMGVIEVRLNVLGAIDSGGYGVTIEPCGPNGEPLPDRGIERSCPVPHDDNGTPGVARFVAVREGHWCLTCQDNAMIFASRCEVTAGGLTPVAITVGSGAIAKWVPVVRLGGKPVPEFELNMHKTGGLLQDYRATWNEETSKPEEIVLPAGEYTAWFPGLPPMKFTLSPGETRKDDINLPVAEVPFSIDSALALALDGPDANPYLDIELDEPFCGGAFGRFFELWQTSPEDFVRSLDPKEAVRRPLPHGSYLWTLAGSRRRISGPLRVSAGTWVHFSLESLPGLARLDIDVPDFDGVEPSHYRFEGIGARIAPEENAHTKGHSRRVRTAGRHEGDVQHLVMNEGRRVVAYAPSGTYRLDFILGNRQGAQIVTIPGRATLAKPEDQRAVDATLVLRAEEEHPVRYNVACYAQAEWASLMSAPSRENVQPGPLRLLVTRTVQGPAGPRVTGFARLEVKLEPGKTSEVNLPELEYEAPGTVTIRCRGRGDPASLIDPWWSGVHGQGTQLYALSDLAARPGDLPGGVELGLPDEFFKQGRLEFAYTVRTLPPGRYKAIPWEGAAEKDCRVFEVLPGRHTEVVIQGG